MPAFASVKVALLVTIWPSSCAPHGIAHPIPSLHAEAPS
jgi:hypothetical protein